MNWNKFVLLRAAGAQAACPGNAPADTDSLLPNLHWNSRLLCKINSNQPIRNDLKKENHCVGQHCAGSSQLACNRHRGASDLGVSDDESQQKAHALHLRRGRGHWAQNTQEPLPSDFHGEKEKIKGVMTMESEILCDNRNLKLSTPKILTFFF